MNRYLSVFGLSARSTLYKLIGIIVAMAAVETGMFVYTMNKVSGSMLLEFLIKDSKIVFVFGIAFIAYYLVLCDESKGGSNAVLTMHRLSIEERTANWIAVIYNVMALIIFLAAQLAICLFLYKLYTASDVSGNYQHVLFTSFYRSDLLHSLLPLEDYTLLVSNILLVVELSILAAYAQQQIRRGKHGILAGAAAGIAVYAFPQDSANSVIAGPIVIGFMAAYAAIYISKGGAIDEDTFYAEENPTDL